MLLHRHALITYVGKTASVLMTSPNATFVERTIKANRFGPVDTHNHCFPECGKKIYAVAAEYNVHARSTSHMRPGEIMMADPSCSIGRTP